MKPQAVEQRQQQLETKTQQKPLIKMHFHLGRQCAGTTPLNPRPPPDPVVCLPPETGHRRHPTGVVMLLVLISPRWWRHCAPHEPLCHCTYTHTHTYA